MSETGETPPVPQKETTPSVHEQMPPRLEDMPEFQKLTPEQQEKLLALRERLTAAAMDQKQVASRSIEEMGFWEGMVHTIRPHLEEKKKLWVKDLKAKGSLALSLIPVLGEGLAFGKGIFGFYKAEKGINKFMPAARVAKAGKEAVSAARTTWEAGKAYQAGAKLSKDAKGLANVGTGIGKAAEWLTRPIRTLFHTTMTPFRVLNSEYAMHAAHTAKKMVGENAVYTARQAGMEAAHAARLKHISEQMDQAAKSGKNLENIKWWELGKRWQLNGIRKAGDAEAARVMRQVNRGIDNMVEAGLAGSGKGAFRSGVEKTLTKAKPTVIEGLGLKKYLALFDQWFNLTPDVPHWLSTTTAVGELLGAHGIDAVPAVIQIGVNKWHDAKVTTAMAKDVFAFVKKRLSEPQTDRKEAATVFASEAPVSAAT